MQCSSLPNTNSFLFQVLGRELHSVIQYQSLWTSVWVVFPNCKLLNKVTCAVVILGCSNPNSFPWPVLISSTLISSIVHLTHHILTKGLKFCLPLEKKVVHIRYPCRHHWHLSTCVTLAPRTLPWNRWSWSQMSTDRWCLLASRVGTFANRLSAYISVQLSLDVLKISWNTLGCN